MARALLSLAGSPCSSVARNNSLVWLDRMLECAWAGTGSVAFVTGEVGTGKSALLAEFVRRAQRSHPDLVIAQGKAPVRGAANDPYAAFRQVLALVTGDVEASLAAGVLDVEQAERLWRLIPRSVQVLEIDPADLKVRSKLADLYKREGNVGKAIEEHVAIAEELTRKGHLNEAVQVLENGLKVDPKHSRLRLELARVYGTQKNFEKAAHVLEEAVRQSPGDAELLSRLCEAYLAAKRIEEAEGVFRRLLELNPQDPEARTQIGRVALLQGSIQAELFAELKSETRPRDLVHKMSGGRGEMPPLGLLTVASHLPSDFEVRLVDRNVSEETDADWEWADVVFLSAMLAKAAATLAA